MPAPPAGDLPGGAHPRSFADRKEEGNETSNRSPCAGDDCRRGSRALLRVSSRCSLRAFPARSSFDPGRRLRDTRATVCRPRYEAQHRLHQTDLAVYWRSAKIVFREYAIRWRDRRHYGFDHRVPLSLGGRQRLANLWPEPRFGMERRAQGCARMAGADPRLPRSPARAYTKARRFFSHRIGRPNTSALWRTMLAQSDDAAAQGASSGGHPGPAGE